MAREGAIEHVFTPVGNAQVIGTRHIKGLKARPIERPRDAEDLTDCIQS